MGILAWIVIGLIAGWLAHVILGGRGGIFHYLAVGLVGAIVGGFLFGLIGHSAPNGINIYSIFVAFVGSVVVLVLYHMVFRGRGRRAL